MKLVLLPGLDGTGLLFEPLLKELPEDIAVKVLRYPDDAARQSYAALADYVEAAVKRQGEFVLLAESFAGPIAFELAKRAPANLKGVIFVSSFLRCPSFTVRFWSRLLPLKWILNRKSPPAFAGRFLLGTHVNEWLQKIWFVVQEVGSHLLLRRIRTVRKLRYKPAKITVPCAYISARHDLLIPPKNIQAFRQCCADLKVYLLSGPHCILLAQTKECAALVVREMRALAA
jgi:pimeloyl-[acyl-carrier protein] methyl ester esterase